MNLTKFQMFIKDEEIEADKDELEAKLFTQVLKDEFDNEYQDVRSDVTGSLDMSDNFEYAIEFNQVQSNKDMNDQITLRVNELIVKTLEEIEDIETTNAQDEEDARGDYLYELQKQERIDNE